MAKPKTTIQSLSLDLIFATNNEHKTTEMRLVLGSLINIQSLQESGIDIDIPEPHSTLEENATEKSLAIYKLTGRNCFSEDTGLEIFALNMEPGVNSARYAGENRNSQDNINLVMANLDTKANRSAQFRTILSLILCGNEYKFEGICKGTIIAEQRGIGGFGYDSVFVPDGAIRTFSEMNLTEKNLYSHRRKAADHLLKFLLKFHEHSFDY